MKCVFLGYPEGVKGYRCWLKGEPGFKTIISRDVVFNETEFPCLVVPNVVLSEDTSNEVEPPPKVKIEPINEEDKGDSMYDQNVELDEPNTENLSDYQLARDRPRRENIRQPQHFDDFHLTSHVFNVFESIDNTEPKSYKEAINSSKFTNWINAMNEEMNSLHVNQTWTLVPKPVDCSLVDCKWLFKVKNEVDSVRYKARLVAKGFTQKEGIDYTEIFAPVVKFTTVRIMLALVAHFNWELKQMDVKTAFLHGELNEKIFMKQPEGFIDKRHPDYVCLLHKSLYGLKQSPRQWNKRFDACMLSLKFTRSAYDPCLYFKVNMQNPVFLLIYVDDMLLVSPCMKTIDHLKNCLSEQFDMKYLGDARRILGMDITRDRKNGTLFLNQTSYVKKILEKFSMIDAKAVTVPLAAHFLLSKDQSPKTETEMKSMKSVPYSNAIGSVMYLMVSTRPDIAYAVSCLSRYMSNPGMTHWEALKWLLRYLKGSVDIGINFSKCVDGVKLVGYVDSNYANDRDKRKSTTSYVFTLCGSCISWKSQLQHIVALSTTESEYVAATEALKEAIWLKGLIHEIGFLKDNVVVFSDSQSSIQLCKNPVFHDRTKHIDVKFHFIRDIVEKGIVNLEKIPSEFNPADMGTKCLPLEKFRSCLDTLNLFSPT